MYQWNVPVTEAVPSAPVSAEWYANMLSPWKGPKWIITPGIGFPSSSLSVAFKVTGINCIAVDGRLRVRAVPNGFAF